MVVKAVHHSDEQQGVIMEEEVSRN